MNSEIRNFIQQLISFKIIKFGQFTLKSGDISPFYIDLRLIPSHPELFKKSIYLLSELISAQSLNTDHYAGLITAGIPFATGLCLKENISLLQVRAESKAHGRKKLIEGEFRNGETVIVIDDLISTGASKIPALATLREKGLVPTSIVVLVDRRKSDQINSSLDGLKIHSLFTIMDILDVINQYNSDSHFLKGIDVEELRISFSNWLQ